MDNPAFEQSDPTSVSQVYAQEISAQNKLLGPTAVDSILPEIELSTIIEEHEDYSYTKGVETDCINEDDVKHCVEVMRDPTNWALGDNDVYRRDNDTLLNTYSSRLKKPETRSRKTQANQELHGIPPSLVVDAKIKLDIVYEELMNFTNQFLHRYAARDPDNVEREEELTKNLDLKKTTTTLEVNYSNTADLERRLKSILKAVKKTKRRIAKLLDFCEKHDPNQVQELQSSSDTNCASGTVQENPAENVNVKPETPTEVHQKGDQALFDTFNFSENKKIDMVTNHVKTLGISDLKNVINKGPQMRDTGTQTEGDITYSNRMYRYYDERESLIKRKRPYLATAVSTRGISSFNFSRTTDTSLEEGDVAAPLERDSYDFTSANRYSRSYNTTWRRKARISHYRSNMQSWRKTEPKNLNGGFKYDRFNFETYDSSNQGARIQSELSKTGNNHLKHSTSDSKTRSDNSSNQETTVRSDKSSAAHGNSNLTCLTKQKTSETEPKKSYADAVAVKK